MTVSIDLQQSIASIKQKTPYYIALGATLSAGIISAFGSIEAGYNEPCASFVFLVTAAVEINVYTKYITSAIDTFSKLNTQHNYRKLLLLSAVSTLNAVAVFATTLNAFNTLLACSIFISLPLSLLSALGYFFIAFEAINTILKFAYNIYQEGPINFIRKLQLNKNQLALLSMTLGLYCYLFYKTDRAWALESENGLAFLFSNYKHSIHPLAHLTAPVAAFSFSAYQLTSGMRYIHHELTKGKLKDLKLSTSLTSILVQLTILLKDIIDFNKIHKHNHPGLFINPFYNFMYFINIQLSDPHSLLPAILHSLSQGFMGARNVFESILFALGDAFADGYSLIPKNTNEASRETKQLSHDYNDHDDHDHDHGYLNLVLLALKILIIIPISILAVSWNILFSRPKDGNLAERLYKKYIECFTGIGFKLDSSHGDCHSHSHGHSHENNAAIKPYTPGFDDTKMNTEHTERRPTNTPTPSSYTSPPSPYSKT